MTRAISRAIDVRSLPLAWPLARASTRRRPHPAPTRAASLASLVLADILQASVSTPAPYAPSAMSSEDGYAQLFVCAFILIVGAIGMQTSLENEEVTREAALADKVRSQMEAMARASQTAMSSDGKVGAISTALVVERLRTRGVARVDGVLSAETSASLASFVAATLDANEATTGKAKLSPDVFGNVYCKKNRWDVKLAYDAPVKRALEECARGLGDILREACGDDARLVELAALVSDPGSMRQPVHPDTAYRRDPTVYTTFVALQDVTRDMGPTLFIPETNTARAHAEFRDGAERGGLALARGNEVALISRGDATMFDSRTLHCGMENESDTRRVLFYFSFQVSGSDNPNAAVSTIREDLRDRVTLADLLPSRPSSRTGM